MPETTITIDRDQRAGLYELVRNHLVSIEDLWVALERTRDFDTAERLGEEFAEDFLLLRDIGWSEHDFREGYVLTMPADELGDLLRRLREEGTHVLIEHGTEARAAKTRPRTVASRSATRPAERCWPISASAPEPEMSQSGSSPRHFSRRP